MLLKAASEKWANIYGENESDLVSFLRRGRVKGRQQNYEVEEREPPRWRQTEQNGVRPLKPHVSRKGDACSSHLKVVKGPRSTQSLRASVLPAEQGE